MNEQTATDRVQIIPYIFYRDVPTALEWLARVFGFVETMRTTTPGGGVHGEMTFGGRLIMMGQGSAERKMASPRDAAVATQGVFIYLAGVDAHFERAKSAGAAIDKPPQDLPYGRGYTAIDLDGHPWFFTTPPAE